MTDIREVLRRAEETDVTPPAGGYEAIGRGKRLRWYRRLKVAVPATLGAIAIGLVVLMLLPTIEGVTHMTSSHKRPRNGTVPTPTAPSRRKTSTHRSAASRPDEQSTAEQLVPSRPAGSAWLPAAACTPLITDAKGDIDNPAVDIRESNITYDRFKNRLTFVHRMEDIPSTPPPGEALVYRLNFDWDGLTYYVTAIEQPGGEFSFGVARESRKQAKTGWVTVTDATGHIDRQTDTATIYVDVAEFNRGERRVAADEGMKPAAALEVGSRLTNIVLTAHPDYTGLYAAQSGPHDTAVTRPGCDYTIG